MAQILDYSAGYPGAANIQLRGFAGGNRYLPKEGASSVRPLTRAEVLDYQAHHLELAFVYQHVSKSRVLQGRAAGRHDAEWALARARDCGVEPRCVYFAVDFDTISLEQWAAVREYMLGAAEVLGVGRVGTYGEYDLLDYLFARGSITWGWQTYAWSTGHNKDNQPRHPRAHLFQRAGQVTVGGISCDVNDVLATNGDYGQHPSPQEDDMVTQADADLIANTLLAKTLNLVQEPGGAVSVPVRTALEFSDLRQQIVSKQINALTAKVDAGFGALTDDEAKIIAAVRAAVSEIPAGGQVDVPALAAALASIGTLVARVPDDQIQQLLAELDQIPVSVRQQLAAALAGGTPS